MEKRSTKVAILSGSEYITGVSIVVPAWNEEGNITPLVKRIDTTMRAYKMAYEVILVDDRSTDKTVIEAQALTAHYRLVVVKKQGKQGKAQSLLEGFAKAKYPLIAMIDADLQYPPEAIGPMAAMVEQSADIIVAKRTNHKTSLLRQTASKGFQMLFGRILHGLDCDVQSGLKVFRKEILERVTVNPSPWTFDLEFLIKARSAGYTIADYTITFAERFAGKTKVQFVRQVIEIGLSAVGVKLQNPPIIPLAKGQSGYEGNGFHYKGQKYVTHTTLHHTESALYRLTCNQLLIGLIVLFIVAMGFLFNWYVTLIAVIAVITCLYTIDLLFTFFVTWRSFSAETVIDVTQDELNAMPDSELPLYTILCPMYKEWEILPQFVTSISRLNYPKNKLQVLLLLEEDDRETINNAKQFNLPNYYEIVVVPHSLPKTKPKACNYGLTRTVGDFTVIYDAEDVPDVNQLRMAVAAFRKQTADLVCVQAKLNYYNPNQNFLTRLFTAEYSLWFDMVLPGLQSLYAPLPLGGTSNHFKTDALRKLNGWDPFNVTEDCDLGIRLFKHGFRTAVIDSVTLEEANSQVGNWLRQRSRWMKGYMQSYLVHMRSPQMMVKNNHHLALFIFQAVIGYKILTPFINPFMWAITISYFVFRASVGPTIESLFPQSVLYMGVFSLILGNFVLLYSYMVALAKREQYDLIPYGMLVPLYWFAMSVAGFMALYDLIFRPHHWQKTKHGLFLQNKKAVAQASSSIGGELIDTQYAFMSKNEVGSVA